VARLKTDLQQTLLQAEVRNRSLQMLQTIGGASPERQIREAEMLLREARVRLSGDRQALLNLGLPLRLEELAGQPDEEVGRRLARLGLPYEVVRKAGDGALPADLLPMYAPFDGLVIHHEAVLGEVVSTKEPQFTVADVSTLMVHLNLRVEDANRVAVGQEVTFRPDGTGVEARGPLDWVSAEVDQKTRTVRARATVPNPQGRLRPRTFGTGRVLTRVVPNAVAVPDAAVQWEAGKAMVFVRQSPTEYLPRPVLLGLRQGGYTQVLGPLPVVGASSVSLLASPGGAGPLLAASALFSDSAALEGVRPGDEVVTTGSHVLRSEMLKERIGGED
jgi:membrane fusion protein, heavy metal efflux system